MPKDDKIRFTLEMSPDLNDTLDKMAAKIGSSKSDVLRRAMLLLGITLDARDRGNKFAITDGDGKTLHEVIVL